MAGRFYSKVTSFYMHRFSNFMWLNFGIALLLLASCNANKSKFADATITVDYNPATITSYRNRPLKIVPEINGKITHASINPKLPMGLTFDKTTAIIEGTPTEAMKQTYTIRAQNDEHHTTTTVTLNLSQWQLAAYFKPLKIDATGFQQFGHENLSSLDNGSGALGSVYVYNINNGIFSFEALLRPPNRAQDNFGYSVALWGNDLVVSSLMENSSVSQILNANTVTGYDHAGPLSGAAYIFKRK